MRDLSYEDLQDMIHQHHGTMSAADAHGILTGLLCHDQARVCEHWLEAVFGGREQDFDADEHAALIGLCELTRERLNASDYTFEPFLPDDELDLDERAQALGDWCQGFLYGLGYFTSNREWSADCAEILRDIVEISQLDADASGENDEAALFELTEFVRMGVYLIQADVQRPSITPRLH